jgi:hypothetical protein
VDDPTTLNFLAWPEQSKAAIVATRHRRLPAEFSFIGNKSWRKKSIEWVVPTEPTSRTIHSKITQPYCNEVAQHSMRQATYLSHTDHRRPAEAARNFNSRA